MIQAGIALLSGTLAACLLPRQIDGYWLSLLPLVLFLVLLNREWRFLLIAIGGFLWSSLHIHWQLDQRLVDELNNNRVTVHGEVLNLPIRSNYGARFNLGVIAIEGHAGKLPSVVRLSWKNAPESLQPGQVWRLPVKLKRPHGFQNPGGFDYQRWMFQRGIHATGYVRSKDAVRLLYSERFSVNRLRDGINQSLARVCPQCRHMGLIQALAIGFRGNISAAERSLLQETGTAHLIAISGLHIGIIAGWFFLLGGWLWKLGAHRSGLNRREFALTLGWLAGFAYAMLSGFDLPAQRAMLMLSVVFASLWLRMPVNLLHSVFTALVLVLLVSPLAVLAESFWLTFSALMVISLGSLLLRGKRSMVIKLAYIQLLFSLLFIPVSILIFAQIQVASLLANLVAVPLVSLLIVPFNFILLVFNAIGGEWLAPLYQLLDGMLGGLVSYLETLHRWGLQAWRVPQWNAWMLLLLCLFLMTLILPRGLLLPRAWGLLLPLVILWPSDRKQAELRFSTLDVGMGTSIVIQTRNHSLVYDFGAGNKEGYSLGKWVLLPFLQHSDIDYVDKVVISHADQDHLGGYYGIRQQLAHGTVYSGTVDEVVSRLPGIGIVQNCHRSRPWRWDGISFRFLSADYRQSDSENNRSCVLMVEYGGQRILIAGDIEASQERKLLQQYPDLKANVLIAPHHGSLTSSTAAFIEAVAAEQVIFTVGYLNRWQFPRPEVVQRYLERGATLYRTDLDGALLLECENSHCRIQSYRRQRPRLWY